MRAFKDTHRFPKVSIPGCTRASLTARIKSACRCGAFRVRVVRQGWGKPLYSEESLLGMRHGRLPLCGRWNFSAAGSPQVFARTLIPASSSVGPNRRLVIWGNRPLGEVLFSDQRARRGVTQVARLLPRHRLFVAAVAELEDPPAEIWGVADAVSSSQVSHCW